MFNSGDVLRFLSTKSFALGINASACWQESEESYVKISDLFGSDQNLGVIFGVENLKFLK